MINGKKNGNTWVRAIGHYLKIIQTGNSIRNGKKKKCAINKGSTNLKKSAYTLLITLVRKRNALLTKGVQIF